MNKIILGNCLEILPDILSNHENVIIVTDPPFNIGYKYDRYKDRMPEDEYFNMLAEVFSKTPSVVVHYPEAICKLAIRMQKAPERVVSWVYNSNTARQHRDIAFFDVKPDFKAVRQPYKNPNDKRIKERIARGLTGCKLYDWWEVNQVKNVNKDKTAHPCQMPVKVMENIIGILPKNATIVDPFAGSATTGVACANLGRNFIGIEIDEKYYQIAKQRIYDACEPQKEAVGGD